MYNYIADTPTPTPTIRLQIGFTSSQYTIAENAGELSVTVQVLSGVVQEAVILSLVTMSGTATGNIVIIEMYANSD